MKTPRLVTTRFISVLEASSSSIETSDSKVPPIDLQTSINCSVNILDPPDSSFGEKIPPAI